MLAPKGLALSILLLAVAAPGPAKRGKYVDVWGKRPASVKRISRHAEDVAARFVEIYGSFPGKRAAVVLYGSPAEAAEVKWRKGGARWQIPFPDLPELDPEEGEEDNASGFRDMFAWAIFSEHVNDRAHPSLRKKHNDIGSYLADWLDEACKHLCQTEATRKERAADLAKLLRKRHLPLDTLFTTGMDAMMGIDQDARPGVQEIELDDRQALWIGESGSVAEYLLESYGVVFWRHVVTTFAKNRGMKAALPWIARNRKKLANPKAPIPKTVAELEKAWLSWAKAR